MKYFDMEGVKLTFTEGSLKEIARSAIKKDTGARALRSILEDIMLEVMYELPSSSGVTECAVTEETIRNKEKPQLIKGSKEKRVA
jgi:ATP-dependent Clp protease ATP-binding subunit ClpX